MSELPETRTTTSEVIPLRPTEQDSVSLRFAGLPIEKALAVAERYLATVDVDKYLRPFLGEMRLIASIAYDLGENPDDVRRYIEKLEVKIAEEHLARIPRGYGHSAAILTILANQDSA